MEYYRELQKQMLRLTGREYACPRYQAIELLKRIGKPADSAIQDDELINLLLEVGGHD
jgi:hypothetical protein